MKHRQWAIRIVLVIGLLATVATSAPEDFFLNDQAEMTFTGPTTVRAFVRINARSVTHSDEFRVDMTVRDTTGAPFTVQAVPDDPNWEVQSVDVDAGGQTLSFFDALAACDGDGECQFGVSFDIPADAAMSIRVDSTLIAYADPSFFFPENRQFPDDATIEIRFDDASAGQ